MFLKTVFQIYQKMLTKLQIICLSARTFAKLVGKIISTKFMLGDITHLKSGFTIIESRVSWDKKFNTNN